MIDAVGNSGIANITDSEAVFCYQVSSKPAGYKGYTIDNMAVTGFCGIIENDLKNMIIRQFFATPENISQEVAQCVIKPRLMLRFVRRGLYGRAAFFALPFFFGFLRRQGKVL